MFINNDDFKRGYENGKKDSLEGKDRNYWQLPFSKKYLYGSILGGVKKTENSYINGYKKGYLDGLRKNNSTITISLGNNINTPQNNESVKPSHNNLSNTNSVINKNPNMQLCLKCARQEHDLSKTECQCGGALWAIQNVAGIAGNYDIDTATKLIRQGEKPWSSNSNKNYSLNKGGSMAQPHIEQQIETLEELVKFLNNFNKQLEENSKQFNRFLEDLEEQRLDAKIHDIYKNNFLDPTIAKINTITTAIEQADIPYLRRIIGHLEDTPY